MLVVDVYKLWTCDVLSDARGRAVVTVHLRDVNLHMEMERAARRAGVCHRRAFDRGRRRTPISGRSFDRYYNDEERSAKCLTLSGGASLEYHHAK